MFTDTVKMSLLFQVLAAVTVNARSPIVDMTVYYSRTDLTGKGKAAI